MKTQVFENESFDFMEHEKPYDLSSLQAMSGDDPTFLPIMAKLFLDTVPAVMEKINEALEKGDWKTVGAQAHKLKPTIDALQITSIGQTIRWIELHGKQEKDVELIPAKVKQVRSVLEICMKFLREEFEV